MRSRFDIAAAAQDTSLRLLRSRVNRAEATAGDAVAEAMRLRAELRKLQAVRSREQSEQRAVASDVKGWQDECDRLGRLLRRERVDHDATRDDLRNVRDEASGAWHELVRLREAMRSAESELSHQEGKVQSRGVSLHGAGLEEGGVAQRARELALALQRELDTAEARLRAKREELEEERIRHDRELQRIRDELTMAKARVRTRDATVQQQKKQIAELKSRASADAAGAKEELEGLRRQVDSLNGQMGALRQDASKAREELG